MKEHYLTTQHQNVVLKCIHQMKSRTTTDDTTKTEASELTEILNILSGGIEALVNDNQNLTIEASQQQGKRKQIEEQSSTMKLSVEESQSFLPGFKYNQDVLQQEVMSLKESVDDMKYVSYDGTFIWKISNFKEKMSKI